MIDIHNHLLFGIDDGSRSIDESLEVLKEMEKCGYTDIILTPHYIKDTRYSSSKQNNLELLNILKDKLNKNNISINLYLGNEIFMDDNISELLNDNLASTLNDTKYVLVELPMSGEYPGYQEVFKELIDEGYKVILAHPERYLTVQDDYSLINEFIEIGLLLQSNIDSLVGKYGPDAERIIIKLLKEKRLTFLATDIHHPKHNYKVWNQAKDIALKYISEEEFNNLTIINPSQLIDKE